MAKLQVECKRAIPKDNAVSDETSVSDTIRFNKNLETKPLTIRNKLVDNQKFSQNDSVTRTLGQTQVNQFSELDEDFEIIRIVNRRSKEDPLKKKILEQDEFMNEQEYQQMFKNFNDIAF